MKELDLDLDIGFDEVIPEEIIPEEIFLDDPI